MEVVGKQAHIPQSSAWATPLTFTPNHDQPPPCVPVMQPNSQSTSTHATSNSSSNPPAQHDPFFNPSDPLRSAHAPSMLVRSESAPINILEENSVSLPSVPDLSDLSISSREPPSLDSDPTLTRRPYAMNFAAAAASGVASSPSSASTPSLGQFVPPTQRNNLSQSHATSSKPPPPRSLSSVELAAIVNGARAPGVGAVPARMPSNANPAVGPAPASANAQKKGAAVSTASASATKPAKSVSKATVPAWHKSVFDMIQDDFPRTPAPMFSSMMPRVANGQENGSHQGRDGRANDSEGGSCLHSTTYLDLDLDLMGKPKAAKREINPAVRAQDDLRPPRDSTSRHHHRRSASINWTGDISGLGAELTRDSSRSNMALSPNIARQYSRKHIEVPPLSSPPSSAAAGQSVVISSNNSLPAAIGASPSSSPTESLSPTVSGQPNGISMSSPQASPVMPLSSHMVGNIGSIANGSHPQMNPYALPTTGRESLQRGGIDEFGVSGLSDYDYLYDRVDSSVISATGANPLSAFPNQGYSAQRNVSIGSGLGGSHSQPHVTASQYANVFPGMSLFPSPFSTNTPGIGNGAGGPIYTDSFRDGLAVADNLKNMSIQMAAFLSAQQQMYAAQMAQMAALTGNSAYNPSTGAFGNGTLSGAHIGHTGNGTHVRSPWDGREPSPTPHRNYARGKHQYDHFRGGSGAHVGNQKKGSGVDVGHKGRSGRSRRGHRGHEDALLGGHHKSGDRAGIASNGLGMQDASQTRSPLLDEFRATSLSIGRGIGDVGLSGVYGAGAVGQAVHSGREWQLSEIKDNVVEFATDQHGSRFIQQKLESASAQDKDSILKSALLEAQRLMTDVFGNYVVQKLLDHGGENAVKLIAAELEGRMLALSLHMYGCRVVQKALEVLESKARAKLVRELDGHVLKCIRDQNGNHVIQKCVELVEPEAVQFIVESVQGQAVVLAGHSYGCRVVQRILEHGAPNQKAPIMVEIMSSIADLIKDQYGNYVIQHVVEHGTIEERAVIMDLVQAEVVQLSQHKFASNVVERCLQHGSLEEREILIEILIVGEGSPNSSPLNHLVRDQFGNYVVQRVLDVARPPQRERVVTILRAQVPAIKKYSYGKHIIARLEEHQGSANPSGFHHGHGAHVHGTTGHPTLHRERHVNHAVMSVSSSHNIPHGHHGYLY